MDSSGSDKSFPRREYTVLAIISDGYPILPGRFPRITHPSATKRFTRNLFVRLACIRPATSVRSEPGSNSQIKTSIPDGNLLSLFFLI